MTVRLHRFENASWQEAAIFKHHHGADMVISQVNQTSSCLKFCPLGHLHVGIFFRFNPREVWNNKSSNYSVLLYNWLQLTYSCIKEEKCDFTKIPIFEIYAMGWYIQKDQDEKSPLAKNQPVSGNWWEDINTHLFWWLHTNHPKVGLDLKVNNSGLF